MSDFPHRFFLEAIDPDYGCTVLEAMFEVTDIADLRAFLGPCADNDPEFRGYYPLETADLANIGGRFGVSFDPGGPGGSSVSLAFLAGGALSGSHELRVVSAPRRDKAVRARTGDISAEQSFSGRPVRPLRRQGLIHKEVFIKPFPTPWKLKDGRVLEGEREVCYTRKGQEWRIPAWRLVRSAYEKSRWNDDFERLQGMLFGYEEWQMDWWIAHIRERRAVVAPDTVSDGS